MNESVISAFLRGVRVHQSESIPEFKDARGEERKWAHRVMFQRNRRFKVKKERVVLFLKGEMYCHPNTASILLRAACEKRLEVRKP